MTTFRDRREEIDDEDEEFDGSPRQKKLFRKEELRDLNPKDKKARREPKKPWGAKERLIVLITLSVTFGASAFFYFSSVGFEVPSLVRPKFPSIELPNYFGEETIIFRK